MGNSFSSVVIGHKVLDIVLPVFDGVIYLASWLHSVVDVVDKCLESLPRGPAGGSFPELEVTISSGNGIGATNPDHTLIEKIRNSLKVVEMTPSSGDSYSDNTWFDDQMCAVCLAELRSEEKMYELPQCKHIFHLPCLDRWVAHNHSTCPLCRTSLITTSSGNTEDDEVEDELGLYVGSWRVPRLSSSLSMSRNVSWWQSLQRLAGYEDSQ